MQNMYKDLQIDNNNGIYRCNTAVRQKKRENRRDNQERTIQKQTTLATRHIASTQKTISTKNIPCWPAPINKYNNFYQIGLMKENMFNK
jgi:hypothetical protein